MVDLETVVKLLQVEYSALAFSFILFVHADRNKWREVKFISDLPTQVVNALGELEDKMRSDKAFAENHHWVSVKAQLISKLENIVLEYIDHLLGEVIAVSLRSLKRPFQPLEGIRIHACLGHAVEVGLEIP